MFRTITRKYGPSTIMDNIALSEQRGWSVRQIVPIGDNFVVVFEKQKSRIDSVVTDEEFEEFRQELLKETK